MKSHRDKLLEHGGRFVEVTTTDDPVLVQRVLAPSGAPRSELRRLGGVAIAGLVVGPIVAHLLHLGGRRSTSFPEPPSFLATAARRASGAALEDFPLLLLRSALIIGLALLGAMPLVRCDRLALGRTSGASVAFALVLDDSASMRAMLQNGRTRWDVAKTGAEQLLLSAREGDAIAIVLAGRPARMALAATTDLGAAQRALDELTISDRATDLPAAAQLRKSGAQAAAAARSPRHRAERSAWTSHR
jgi:hypothetical protein